VEAGNVWMVSYNLGTEDGVLLSLPHCTERVDMTMFMDCEWGKDEEGTLVTTSGECRLLL